MSNVPAWTYEPSAEPAPIMVRDPEAPLVKQAMCADKDSCRNARLTAAALRMPQALSGLLHWAEQTGGWDSPCWAEARDALEAARQD